ncbi:MAG: DUF456 domain-containing protein [Pirellulaceae bacterium]|jgi:hypothetical protein|nr:DUF456 domain-containing protein [Pirellulaceae bacterium]
MYLALAILLVILLIICWLTNIIGLPGNWIAALLAIGYMLIVPPDTRLDIGWITIVVVLVLAVIGEALEAGTSALATSQVGGSKRGAALSLVGSIVGGVAGLFLGSFVPVVGNVIGALLFAGLGAFAGAALGEVWKGRTKEESLKVGTAAFVGRILGTLGKTAVGGVIVVAVIVGLVR